MSSFLRLTTLFAALIFWIGISIEITPSAYTLREEVVRVFSSVGNNIAGVFFVESITIADLHTKYSEVREGKKRIHILIVPGHEPDYGGAEFKGIKERDLVVDLSRYLELLFAYDPHYEVTVSRDTKDWNPKIADYYKTREANIDSEREQKMSEMTRLIELGLVKAIQSVDNNSAPKAVARRLYGINMWANEHDVDIAIHLHFNDNPRRNVRQEGIYSGFSVYVPERQYSNSTTSRSVADAVFQRLSKYVAASNLPVEKAGVIEDQDLVAIGRYNTLDAPSLLIEYGFIYEGQFRDVAIREKILKELAYQTYAGVQDFFGTNIEQLGARDTSLLPHQWNENIVSTSQGHVDILALQAALRSAGFYPPPGKTLENCPLSGRFKNCTQKALKNFQRANKITNESGMIGEMTRQVLNAKFAI